MTIKNAVLLKVPSQKRALRVLDIKTGQRMVASECLSAFREWSIYMTKPFIFTAIWVTSFQRDKAIFPVNTSQILTLKV